MKTIRYSFIALFFTSALFVFGTEEPTADSSQIVAPFEVTIEPDYPLKLRNQGLLEGTASAILVVSREGELLDYLLIEASHVLFGEALMKVIPEWKFSPPLQNGQPVNAARRINVNFDSSGAIISTFGFDAFIHRHPGFAAALRDPLRHQVVPSRNLDAPPKAVIKVEPTAPPADSLEGRTQRVVFTFFIDETGRVRIPVPVESAGPPVDEFLLDSVHNALVQWQFTPPTLDGRPVITQVNQPFDFLPRETSAPPHS